MKTDWGLENFGVKIIVRLFGEGRVPVSIEAS